MSNTIRLDANGLFHHTAALALLTAHAIPGAERVDGAVYQRVITVDGRRGAANIQLDPDGATVAFDGAIDDTTAAVAIVRR
ncbi:AlkA N-terminal domain-containing protein [Streptomyces sp. NPDC051020]|uniref:AlkA N-terminal domain-containing protein n=1 Tax=Streptomyces sp. NPDC051020 TaxID=3155409 RepID=UPI00344844E0